jgi:nitroreductase
MIKKIKHLIGRNYHSLRLLYHEKKLLTKHLGSSNNKNKKEKFRASIIIQAHIIEKGLSFREVKIGFGEEKIINLINDTKEFYLKYDDKDFCEEILGILKSYFEFNIANNYLNHSIYEKYQKLVEFIQPDFNNIEKGGTLLITKEQILKKSKIDFEGFVNSRFSIRNFSEEPVDVNLVLKALKISWKTPSACNRQPWRAHVITNKKKVIDILDFQTGAKQFKEQISCVVLITSTYNSFFGAEFHQPYVNGGLFAMTFIYALHSMGLGTIPLNMGFEYSKLKLLKKFIDIQEDEVPIVLIGVGTLPNELNVACSNRFNPCNYIKIY